MDMQFAVLSKLDNKNIKHTCGLTPNIRRDGGTFNFCGICM